MEIKSIELFNFQSHKHSLVEFTSRYHVISGVSDCGKSAIIRGIRWVLENKPTGDDVVSHWGGETKAIITFFDGNVIEKSRLKKKTKYIINGQELNATGSSVPSEVLDIFNMNEINISSQFEGHFLLNASSGEVARFFNKIIGISDIDDSLKKINALKKEKSSTISVLGNEKAEKEERLNNIKDYTEIKERILIINDIDRQILDDSELAESVRQSIRKIEELSPVIDNLKKLQTVKKLMKKIKLQSDNIDTSIEQIKDVKSTIEKWDSMLGNENKLSNLSRVKKGIARIQINDSKIADLEQDISDIQALVKLQRTLKNSIELNETDIKEQREVLMKELEGKECPLCGK